MSTSFTDLGVPADLVSALERKGITTPFEVQSATIPDGLAGRDVCGRAPTGSGKTLAFGIPLVARVERAQPRRPRALVLAPTRELAAQIQRELEPLARVRGLRVAVVYGGVGYEPQRKNLRKGVDILVACPGRLADLLGQSALTLADVDIVVIDEADRMADMGFLPEVRRLLDRTAEERQTVLFSATLDGDVAVITRDYQRDAVRHEIGAAEPDIHLARHHFWRVEPTDRVARAADVIGAASPTIVFTRTRHGADRVAKQLGQAGVNATPIHGGRSQGQRDRALKDFQHGRVDALIATDVAARGIHVDDVACVVHFDPPVDSKTYQHRSGRTARAGASGVVVSFLSRDQVRDARRMQRILGLPGDVTAPGADELMASRGDAQTRPARKEHVERPASVERPERRAPGRERSARRGTSAARNRARNRARNGSSNGRGNGSGNGSGNGAGRVSARQRRAQRRRGPRRHIRRAWQA
ncbi:MAG: DEAD/DEAH box helicase [Acidimicrobiia bacterium]|nr:DEAD/DEAH box helicase [Acidimicrobiia bacterium]